MYKNKKFLTTFALIALISSSYGSQAEKEELLSRPNSFETKNLIIAPTHVEDIDRIYEMHYDHYALEFMDKNPEEFKKKCPYHPENSNYHGKKQEYTAQVRAYQEKEAHEKSKFTDYSIFLKKAGEASFLGHYKLTLGTPYVNCRKNEPFIDIMMSAQKRGRGYGTEAQQAITQEVIEVLLQSEKWERFNAEILAENEASWKLHEKCGWRSYEEVNIFNTVKYYIYQYPPKTCEEEVEGLSENGIVKSDHISLKEMEDFMRSYRNASSRSGIG
ncbi:GNAT family N-acetyltransferase [Candidatus Odyssella acanthamoebae]|uniref:N-acetyltransferase domain-containing protein n=1 Tax=Candidatus Odyssella acanthamoebae TaxID=91604 RepID=A0A077AVG3_9PROT|nr:GNAT family protein [Candidatus Paracaedibacter acanthamoebae]AIK95643.1 hypothetical protein ID47_01155 [Candidatus Paracaedibacter acanthamoebae]